MYVLLQIYPPEAADHEDRCCCLDVIAVSASETELEQFLAAYEPRYRVACREFDRWDADLAGEDWGEEHDRQLEEIAVKHAVFGSLIQRARFEIGPSQMDSPLVPAQAA
jgi:hypothetical protein